MTQYMADHTLQVYNFVSYIFRFVTETLIALMVLMRTSPKFPTVTSHLKPVLRINSHVTMEDVSINSGDVIMTTIVEMVAMRAKIAKITTANAMTPNLRAAMPNAFPRIINVMAKMIVVMAVMKLDVVSFFFLSLPCCCEFVHQQYIQSMEFRQTFI